MCEPLVSGGNARPRWFGRLSHQLAPVRPKTFRVVCDAPPNPEGGSAALAKPVKRSRGSSFEACFGRVEMRGGSWRDGRSRRDGAGAATGNVRGWVKRERLFQPKGEEGRRLTPHARQRASGMLERAVPGKVLSGRACPSGRGQDRQRAAPRIHSPPKPAVANTYAAGARSKRRELRGLRQGSHV